MKYKESYKDLGHFTPKYKNDYLDGPLDKIDIFLKKETLEHKIAILFQMPTLMMSTKLKESWKVEKEFMKLEMEYTSRHYNETSIQLADLKKNSLMVLTFYSLKNKPSLQNKWKKLKI